MCNQSQEIYLDLFMPEAQQASSKVTANILSQIETIQNKQKEIILI